MLRWIVLVINVVCIVVSLHKITQEGNNPIRYQCNVYNGDEGNKDSWGNVSMHLYCRTPTRLLCAIGYHNDTTTDDVSKLHRMARGYAMLIAHNGGSGRAAHYGDHKTLPDTCSRSRLIALTNVMWL